MAIALTVFLIIWSISIIVELIYAKMHWSNLRVKKFFPIVIVEIVAIAICWIARFI